jgi:GTP diphosphokinase / guanosine-3',5'-bis(diphosphate) 3'-diphosphatase
MSERDPVATPGGSAPGAIAPSADIASMATHAERVLAAVRYAAEMHWEDRRKGEADTPYINHPIPVAEQLAARGLGADAELLMAAVLHDVIEDTDATAEDLRRRFGARVAAIVQEVSDDKTLEKMVRRQRTVETVGAKSREARLIKLSDLIANVHDVAHHPPQWTLERKLNYLLWAERVGGAVAGTHAELEAMLSREIAEARALLAPAAAK